MRILLVEDDTALAEGIAKALRAEHFAVEDIIDPRDTRPLLCEFADLAWARLSAGRR